MLIYLTLDFFKLGEQAFLQTTAIRPYYADPQSLSMCHNLKLVLIPHENSQNKYPQTWGFMKRWLETIETLLMQ